MGLEDIYPLSRSYRRFAPLKPLWYELPVKAALAQLVEHVIRNDGVACSSHASGTTCFLTGFSQYEKAPRICHKSLCNFQMHCTEPAQTAEDISNAISGVSPSSHVMSIALSQIITSMRWGPFVPMQCAMAWFTSSTLEARMA